MPIRSFVEPGAFEPETLAEMAAALDAAYKELQGTGEPEVVRERIASRIIAATNFGERDPARLLAAALLATPNGRPPSIAKSFSAFHRAPPDL
jgi:hypothetical protein